VTIVAGVFGAIASGPRLAGFADLADLVGTLCYVAVTLILFGLFRPVSVSISALAALFSLVGCTLSTLDIFHIKPLHVNYIVFFGFYCLLLGYLIVNSTFFPRPIGVLLALAGLNYLTFFSPALEHHLWPYNLIPGLIAEGALTLWLLIVGVNEQRWEEQAGVVTDRRQRVLT
jgi:hypothetical protein